jgi:CheY-like chemotaxis protein
MTTAAVVQMTTSAIVLLMKASDGTSPHGDFRRSPITSSDAIQALKTATRGGPVSALMSSGIRYSAPQPTQTVEAMSVAKIAAARAAAITTSVGLSCREPRSERWGALIMARLLIQPEISRQCNREILGQIAMNAVAELRDFSPMQKNSTPLKVLVVDDEALIRWSVTETLTDSGYQVFEAGDGRGALEALRVGAPPIDVVLLDFRLPDSNDLDLLSTIRKLSPQSQVILMTAYGTPEVAKGALDLGAFRVVHKPFEMHEMATLVARAYAAKPH